MSQLLKPAPDDPGLVFEAIGEAMWGLRVLAEIGEREALLGNLAGVSYAIRRITATTRFAVSCAADLREAADRQQREPGRAEKTFTISEPA